MQKCSYCFGNLAINQVCEYQRTLFLNKIMYVLYIPWILRINLFKPANPKDELVYISS